MTDHADDRRRVFLALHENPEGIICTDLEREPTIDGLPPMTRVAARIGELREEHTIPMGLRRGAFALYRLQRLCEATVTPLRAREAPQRAHKDGFELVQFCQRCVSTFPQGFRCPAGRATQEWMTGTGPTNAGCTHHANENANEGERRAA
jgi:hypothetical protein